MAAPADLIVMRYHEIALKGRNRPYFVRRLVDQVVRATAGLPVGAVGRASARLVLPLHDRGAWPEARGRVGRIFGLANFSLARAVALDADADASLERLGDAVVDAVVDASGARPVESFRVQTKRADKRFPIGSPEVSRRLGARIRGATGARVDLDHGALTVAVDVLPGRAFFSLEKVAGAGGLPVGTSGRVLALLSGGIDSPVAAWRMMRRGCAVDFVHFHSAPFHDRTSQEKARRLAEELVRWEGGATLHMVAFGEVQRQIVASVGRPIRVVLYRRMMLRIAEAIARRIGAEALVTGESLGQVASQTLPNLAVIESACGLPVLRPLIGMDKGEIANQAERLGTFETSIIPDQDCCQLFVPRHPTTRADPEEIAAAEARLDVDALVALALTAVERVKIRDAATAS